MQEPSLSLSDLSQRCWDRKSKEFRIPVSVCLCLTSTMLQPENPDRTQSLSVSVWPQRCCNQKILTEPSLCLSLSDLNDAATRKSSQNVEAQSLSVGLWSQSVLRPKSSTAVTYEPNVSVSISLSASLFSYFSTSDFGRCRGQKIPQGWWSQALSGSRKKIKNFIGHDFLTLSDISLRVFSVWKMIKNIHRHRVK